MKSSGASCEPGCKIMKSLLRYARPPASFLYSSYRSMRVGMRACKLTRILRALDADHATDRHRHSQNASPSTGADFLLIGRHRRDELMHTQFGVECAESRILPLDLMRDELHEIAGRLALRVARREHAILVGVFNAKIWKVLFQQVADVDVERNGSRESRLALRRERQRHAGFAIDEALRLQDELSEQAHHVKENLIGRRDELPRRIIPGRSARALGRRRQRGIQARIVEQAIIGEPLDAIKVRQV